MKAHTTDDFHQSLETGDLCAFVCVLIAVHPVTNYNKLMRANSGFSQIFKHSISQPVPCKAIETHRPRHIGSALRQLSLLLFMQFCLVINCWDVKDAALLCETRFQVTDENLLASSCSIYARAALTLSHLSSCNRIVSKIITTSFKHLTLPFYLFFSQFLLKNCDF